MGLSVGSTTHLLIQTGLSLPLPERPTHIWTLAADEFQYLFHQITSSQSSLREASFWKQAASDFGKALLHPFSSRENVHNLFFMFAAGGVAGRVGHWGMGRILNFAQINVAERMSVAALRAMGGRNFSVLFGAQVLNFGLNSLLFNLISPLPRGERVGERVIFPSSEILNSTLDFAINHAFTWGLRAHPTLGFIAPLLLGGLTLTASTIIRTELLRLFGLQQERIEDHLDHVAENTAFHLGNFALGIGWERSCQVYQKVKISAGQFYNRSLCSLMPLVIGTTAPLGGGGEIRSSFAEFVAKHEAVLKERVQIFLTTRHPKEFDQDPAIAERLLRREKLFCENILHSLDRIETKVGVHEEAVILWDLDETLVFRGTNFLRPSAPLLMQHLSEKIPHLRFGIRSTRAAPYEMVREWLEGDLSELKPFIAEDLIFTGSKKVLDVYEGRPFSLEEWTGWKNERLRRFIETELPLVIENKIKQAHEVEIDLAKQFRSTALSEAEIRIEISERFAELSNFTEESDPEKIATSLLRLETSFQKTQIDGTQLPEFLALFNRVNEMRLRREKNLMSFTERLRGEDISHPFRSYAVTLERLAAGKILLDQKRSRRVFVINDGKNARTLFASLFGDETEITAEHWNDIGFSDYWGRLWMLGFQEEATFRSRDYLRKPS